MIESFNSVWYSLLQQLIHEGVPTSPRGKPTLELLQPTVVVDMQRPVLTIPERKLGYKFMAAEAHWILTGDNRVSTIAAYSSAIRQFSDDGLTFYGAYGPKILGQVDYVVRKLKDDPDSRQAGLTIWRENPPSTTKDVPCTVAMFFSLREGKLNAHVFMRSSDVWLGLPYDVFNFSMVAHYVCGLLNNGRLTADYYQPGRLFLTMASSHLYLSNLPEAECCLPNEVDQPPTPKFLWRDEAYLLMSLQQLKDSSPGSPYRWWEHPHDLRSGA